MTPVSEPSARKILPRQILTDAVYVDVKLLIMQGSIQPGSRINIEDVARRLDVSPTPVREALARLESEGLVIKLPLKGYRTTELLVPEEVRELYELRLIIEPRAAGKAAAAITDEFAAELRAEIERGREAAKGTDYASYLELSSHDARLHDLVLRIAGNKTIREFHGRTHWHLHTFRLTHAGPFGALTVDEHAEVAEAVASGDTERAEAAMRNHIEGSRERMLERLRWIAAERQTP
ncbi:MAG: GntR family transcriptional regulator [Rhodoglobus sp.]